MTAPKTAAKTRDAKKDDTGGACEACWPDGPPEGHHSGMCEHGKWSRDV